MPKYLWIILFLQLWLHLMKGSILAKMTSPIPQFKIPLSKLMNVPTLDQLSYPKSKELRKQLYKYSSEYENVLKKHLSKETEVQIVDGKVTEESLP